MTTFFIRTLDILFSLTGLVLLSPVLILVTCIGFFDSGSPIFLQKRVGRFQKPFTLIKFRTMYKGTAPIGTHLASNNAITPLGHILRKTKLDELLQLINVLTGSMSIVGPRPSLFNQTELINERKKRDVYLIRPGITGLGQINQIDMSTPRKLAHYDQKMAQNMSITLYLMIILATAFGKGQGDRVKSQNT